MRSRTAPQGTQCTMSPLSLRVSASRPSQHSPSSRQHAPDALENSPGSHAAQALASATQHHSASCQREPEIKRGCLHQEEFTVPSCQYRLTENLLGTRNIEIIAKQQQT